MRFNDERLAGKIELIRAQQLARRERARDQNSPVHAVSDEMLLTLRDLFTEANISRIQNHPAYRTMAVRQAVMNAPVMGDNRVLSHALRDSARFAAAIWCLGLAASPGGLTFSRFQSLLETLKVGSKTWSYATFGYLRFLGYIEPGQGSADRRERRFQPTRLLREGLRSHLAEGLQIIGPMEPAAQAMGDRLMADDAVFDQVVRHCSDGLVAGWLITAASPEQTLAVMVARRSGLPMLWTLVMAAPEGEYWPTAEPYPIRIAELARRAGVSRPHFTRMLRDGQAAGMLELDETGVVRLNEILREHVNALMALNIICYSVAAVFAQAALGETRAA